MSPAMGTAREHESDQEPREAQDACERGLSQIALATLRGILVSSLSRENLSPVDVEPASPPLPPARRRRRVRFSESKSVDCLDQDHVFEVMMYVDNSIYFDKPSSVLNDWTVLQEIVKKSGFRLKMIPPPDKVDIIEDTVDVAKRYYELLLFTKDQETARPSISNFGESQKESSDETFELTAEDYGSDDTSPGTQETDGGQGNHNMLGKRPRTFFKEPLPKRKTRREVDKEITQFMQTCTAALSAPPTVLDDCMALGTYVSEKLRNMDGSQQILAEALIQKIITKGMKNQLTENTELIEIAPIQELYGGATATHGQHSSTLTVPPCEPNDGLSLARYFTNIDASEISISNIEEY